ncbi:MAG: hypothetical protein Q9190_001987 [Brigantiaea leucoxantha]
MGTILNYLTRQNLNLDRSYLPGGANTTLAGSHDIEGVRPWHDFTLANILACFGDVLEKTFPTEEFHKPSEVPHYLRVVTALLLKHNHVKVDCALRIASEHLQSRRPCLPVTWTWGSLGTLQYNPSLRPDWAGIYYSAGFPYLNLVPGDTKQSQKWNSNMDVPASREEFKKPLRQVLTYCIEANSRYGYIITDRELYVFRRTKSPEPDFPLSTNRPQRQRTHERFSSIGSTTSAATTMSSGSPYTDAGNPDINEAPLEVLSIPWENSGHNTITINLALWFIHMLAASDNSVQEWYPQLGSWQVIGEDKGKYTYQQSGSNRTTQKLPKGARIGSPITDSGKNPVVGRSRGSGLSTAYGPIATPSSSHVSPTKAVRGSMWRAAKDLYGNEYYYNSKTRESTYHREFKGSDGSPFYYHTISKKNYWEKPKGELSLTQLRQLN